MEEENYIETSGCLKDVVNFLKNNPAWQGGRVDYPLHVSQAELDWLMQAFGEKQVS